MGIYNSLIYAFGKAGDAQAAEFYYWEMQYKGLAPNSETYNNLLNAYAKEQSIGARTYGRKGRYVKPLPRPPTHEEQALMDVGPRRAAELMSEGLYFSGDGDVVGRKAKHKGQLRDILTDGDTQLSSSASSKPILPQELKVRLPSGEVVTAGVDNTGAMHKLLLWNKYNTKLHKTNRALGGSVDHLTGNTVGNRIDDYAKSGIRAKAQIDFGQMPAMPTLSEVAPLHDNRDAEDDAGGNGNDGMYGWIEKEGEKNIELHSEQTLDDLDIVELSRTDPAVAELLRVLKEEDHVDLEEMLEVSMGTPGEKEALNIQPDADAIMGDINEWENSQDW